LIYGNQYHLTIQQDDKEHTFNVELKIPLW
jgi:hypothetical protein